MNDLYKAIVAYEDAANEVGRMSIITQGAYVQLAKAIGGWGALDEARARFRLESAAFVNASNALTAAAGRIDLALIEAPGEIWPLVSLAAPCSVLAGADERYRSLAEREPGLRDVAKGTTGCGEDA